MEIVPYIDNGKRKTSFNWIDHNTLKTIQCIISNSFDILSKGSFQRVVVMNLPLRAWNCINGCQEKNYWKVALDVLAFSSLFFPVYRPKVTILIDLASEAINLYIKMNHHSRASRSLSFWDWSNQRLAKIKNFFINEKKTKEIDCTIRENALKVLDLSAEEAEDRSILNERYQDLYKAWSERMVEAKKLKSEFLAQEFEKRLCRVQIAYKTLTQ